jgi:hypothetical protein
MIVALAAAAGAVHAASPSDRAGSGPSPQAAPQPPGPATPPGVPKSSAPSPVTPASDATLNAIRAQIKKGEFKEALTALKPLQATGPVVRLRIDAALGAREFAAALAALDELPPPERKDSPALLATITRSVIEEAGRHDDQLAKLEGCKALISHGAHACAKQLQQQSRNAKEPLPVRLAATAALAADGNAAAIAEYETLAAQASDRGLGVVVGTARALPPATAVKVVVPALQSTQASIQYSAATLLGELPSPESRKALVKFLEDGARGAPRSAAELSLAMLGDEARLKEILAALPELQGGDLLRVGKLLTKRGDTRGVDVLVRATKDDRERIRIEAGAALSDSVPDVARRVLLDALAQMNPLLRAAALEEYRDSRILTAQLARGLLLDGDALVQIRAGDALLARLTPRQK